MSVSIPENTVVHTADQLFILGDQVDGIALSALRILIRDDDGSMIDLNEGNAPVLIIAPEMQVLCPESEMYYVFDWIKEIRAAAIEAARLAEQRREDDKRKLEGLTRLYGKEEVLSWLS